jgi:hypothetical protein
MSNPLTSDSFFTYSSENSSGCHPRTRKDLFFRRKTMTFLDPGIHFKKWKNEGIGKNYMKLFTHEWTPGSRIAMIFVENQALLARG